MKDEHDERAERLSGGIAELEPAIADALREQAEKHKAEILRITRGEFGQICSYCGWESDRAGSQWEDLQAHINECVVHPVTKLKAEINLWRESADSMKAAWNAACVDVDKFKSELERKAVYVENLQHDTMQLRAELEKYKTALGQATADLMGCRDGALLRDLREENERLKDKIAGLKEDMNYTGFNKVCEERDQEHANALIAIAAQQKMAFDLDQLRARLEEAEKEREYDADKWNALDAALRERDKQVIQLKTELAAAKIAGMEKAKADIDRRLDRLKGFGGLTVRCVESELKSIADAIQALIQKEAKAGK